MIRDYLLAYDDQVFNGVAAFTPTAFLARLGLYDQLAFQAIADNTKGTGNGTLNIRVQHSGDGENDFQFVNTAVDLSMTLHLDTSSDGWGYTDAFLPMLPLVRIRMALTGLIMSARVRLYVIARDPSD